MNKFFVKSNQIYNNKINITGEDVNHIKNVFRKKAGDTIEVCNQDTSDSYIAEIEILNKENIVCNIVEKISNTIESNLYIHIFQGLPKNDKMELIIQKSVELGVSEITPVFMTRCVVKLDSKTETKKIQRWQKISEAAAKQSKRDIVPKVNNVVNIQNICNLCKDYDIVIVAYENETEIKLKTELKKLKEKSTKNKIKIAIVIGPEGGLETSEVETLKKEGAKVVTLGKRILRTETVALNMISVITYELEN